MMNARARSLPTSAAEAPCARALRAALAGPAQGRAQAQRPPKRAARAAAGTRARAPFKRTAVQFRGVLCGGATTARRRRAPLALPRPPARGTHWLVPTT
jgi:hypothetical protein